jgi:PucR C-terminal helix-turn-helix domain/GGDEF-like domain
MNCDGDGGCGAELATLGSVLAGRSRELAEALADRILKEMGDYKSLVPQEVVLESCRAAVDAIWQVPCAHAPAIRAMAAAYGRARAADGVPLAVLMDSYRIGLRVLWEAVLQADRGVGALDRDGLAHAASALWDLTDILLPSMTEAYQKAVHEKALARERERAALVGVLLDGHARDVQQLWDTIEALRLPHDIPYVLVAAEAEEVLGMSEQEKIRVVENRLARAGIPSAWRPLPDAHIGIAAVRGAGRFEALTEVLSAWEHRVGISPWFEIPGEARRALRFAKLAMAGAPRGSRQVTVFGEAPVAVLAASAPDVMAKVAETVLGSLNRLPDDERAVLVGTLRTWLTCGGSVDATAKALCCHPNTVRYRLNRVTEHTGRSVTDPRDVTELSLALQADLLNRPA